MAEIMGQERGSSNNFSMVSMRIFTTALSPSLFFVSSKMVS